MAQSLRQEAQPGQGPGPVLCLPHLLCSCWEDTAYHHRWPLPGWLAGGGGEREGGNKLAEGVTDFDKKAQQEKRLCCTLTLRVHLGGPHHSLCRHTRPHLHAHTRPHKLEFAQELDLLGRWGSGELQIPSGPRAGRMRVQTLVSEALTSLPPRPHVPCIHSHSNKVRVLKHRTAVIQGMQKGGEGISLNPLAL